MSNDWGPVSEEQILADLENIKEMAKNYRSDPYVSAYLTATSKCSWLIYANRDKMRVGKSVYYANKLIKINMSVSNLQEKIRDVNDLILDLEADNA